MDRRKQKLSIAEVKEWDMVDYLSGLGYLPAKVRGNDYWYHSPLREERIPSFKINRRLNRWYDHGMGKGGSLIDFGMEYYNCTVAELLDKCSSDIPFQANSWRSPLLPEKTATKISISREAALSAPALLYYLEKRKISLPVACQYLREIQYTLHGKTYYAIGFKNDLGGFELRNPYFKGSGSPKGFTSFNNGAEEVAVFEGFMDFLSFKTIHPDEPANRLDFMVLNSLSFFEKGRPFMEAHAAIRLYLDRDTAGQSVTKQALSLSTKYTDESGLYQHHKDFNEWLVNSGKRRKQSKGLKL